MGQNILVTSKHDKTTLVANVTKRKMVFGHMTDEIVTVAKFVGDMAISLYFILSTHYYILNLFNEFYSWSCTLCNANL